MWRWLVAYLLLFGLACSRDLPSAPQAAFVSCVYVALPTGPVPTEPAFCDSSGAHIILPERPPHGHP